MIMFVI